MWIEENTCLNSIGYLRVQLWCMAAQDTGASSSTSTPCKLLHEANGRVWGARWFIAGKTDDQYDLKGMLTMVNAICKFQKKASITRQEKYFSSLHSNSTLSSQESPTKLTCKALNHAQNDSIADWARWSLKCVSRRNLFGDSHWPVGDSGVALALVRYISSGAMPLQQFASHRGRGNLVAISMYYVYS